MALYTSYAQYLKDQAGIKTFSTKTKSEVREANNKARTKIRQSLLAQHRLITDSPIPPTPLKENTEPKEKVHANAVMIDPRVQLRRLQLQKWLQHRDHIRAADKAKQKPLFKSACHIESNPVIYSTGQTEKHTFAQNNHKFKAPANIKPILFTNYPSKNVNIIEQETEKEFPTRRKLNYVAEAKKTNNVVKKLPKKVVTKNTQLENHNEKGSVRATRCKSVETIPIDKPTRLTRQTSKVVETIKTSKSAITKLKPKPKVRAEPVTSENPKSNKKASDQKSANLKQRQVTNDVEPKVTKKVERKNTKLENDKEKISVKSQLKVAPTKTKKTNENETKEKPTRQTRLNSKAGNTRTDINEADTATGKKAIETMPESPDRKFVAKTPVKTPRARKSIKMTPKKQYSSVEEVQIKSTSVDTVDLTGDTDNESMQSILSIDAAGMSSEYPMDNVFDSPSSTSESDKYCTPIKDKVLAYVSPFVTMSRGKNSARKEYKSRSSKGGFSEKSPEATSIQAGAKYFYGLLDDEIGRIQELCQQWEQYKESEILPEEATELIDVAIGQSNLLISSKMAQFRQLIDKSAVALDGPVITCADLHGFWDMVMIQVNNLNKRYVTLSKLRENNWEEVIPEKKKTPKEKPKKRFVPKRGAKEATSQIRAAINLARANNRKLLTVESNEFNGGFFNIKSPFKDNTAITPRKSVRMSTSLLRTVLTVENRKSITSPGLAMIKATKTAHNVEVKECTPKKSILKMTTPMSSLTKHKAVLFKEYEAVIHPFVPHYSEHDNENDVNVENIQVSPEMYSCLQKDKTPVKPRRFSRRLSKLVDYLKND